MKERRLYSILKKRNIHALFHYVFLTAVIAFGLVSMIATGGGRDNDDNSDNGGAGTELPSCEETIKVLVNTDDVSTLLGISAAEVLEETNGGFTITSVYSNDTSALTQSPLGGETELTVAISYNGGEIREIKSQAVEGDGDGIVPEIAVECRHRMEIEVSVAVSTADGVFAENWQGVLVKTTNSEQDGFDDPYLTAEFDPAGIQGGFKIVSISGETPDSVAGAFSALAVSPFSGSIDILVQQTSGEGEDSTVSMTRHVALSWGKAS